MKKQSAGKGDAIKALLGLFSSSAKPAAGVAKTLTSTAPSLAKGVVAGKTLSALKPGLAESLAKHTGLKKFKDEEVWAPFKRPENVPSLGSRYLEAPRRSPTVLGRNNENIVNMGVGLGLNAADSAVRGIGNTAATALNMTKRNMPFINKGKMLGGNPINSLPVMNKLTEGLSAVKAKAPIPIRWAMPGTATGAVGLGAAGYGAYQGAKDLAGVYEDSVHPLATAARSYYNYFDPEISRPSTKPWWQMAPGLPPVSKNNPFDFEKSRKKRLLDAIKAMVYSTGQPIARAAWNGVSNNVSKLGDRLASLPENQTAAIGEKGQKAFGQLGKDTAYNFGTSVFNNTPISYIANASPVKALSHLAFGGYNGLSDKKRISKDDMKKRMTSSMMPNWLRNTYYNHVGEPEQRQGVTPDWSPRPFDFIP